jgi:hypothetical protein
MTIWPHYEKKLREIIKNIEKTLNFGDPQAVIKPNRYKTVGDLNSY